MRLSLLGLVCLLTALISLTIGPADLSALSVLKAIAGTGTDIDRTIVWEIRLPRTLLAMMIGATLALSGAALQGFVRNPLASPSLLGTSNFAALGAVIAIYFGTSACGAQMLKSTPGAAHDRFLISQSDSEIVLNV